MVSHSIYSDRDPLPASPLIGHPSGPPATGDASNEGGITESQGFARGQHTNYGATPKSDTMPSLAPTSSPSARFLRGGTALKGFAVLCMTVLILFVLQFASLKYSYDRIRLRFELEQSDMRWNWRKEVLEHESATRRWELEREANQTQARLEWRKEELAHEGVREGWDKEWRKQEWEHERVKENWARERREQESQIKRAREEWNKELQKREWEHERVKEKWARERREREAQVKRAKEEWAKERQQWNAERKEWENERRKYLPYFEEPALRDPHCRAFNTREYQARLWNIRLPGDNRWLEACMTTATKIHGRTFKAPNWCADQVCLPTPFIFTGSIQATESSPFLCPPFERFLMN